MSFVSEGEREARGSVGEVYDDGMDVLYDGYGLALILAALMGWVQGIAGQLFGIRGIKKSNEGMD